MTVTRSRMPPLLCVLIALFVLAAGVSFMAGRHSDLASADNSIDAEEQAFADLLNQHRVSLGLSPLLIDPHLNTAAEWMSTDLANHAYFSHDDSLGRTPWTRMCDFQYCYNTWKGENIAAGFAGGAEVYKAWYDSPEHRANMESPDYTVMGLARVYVPGSPYGYYWTNDFGGAASSSAVLSGLSPTPTPTSTPERGGGPATGPTPTPTATP